MTVQNNLLEKTILAFDFGTKRIGLAVGSYYQGAAAPLRVIQAQPVDWPAIDQTIKGWKPGALVVGLPLQLDGTEQEPITRLARSFACALAARTALPLFLQDERLSSVEAKSLLFEAHGFRKLKKAPLDAYAAALILNDFLTQSYPRRPLTL